MNLLEGEQIIFDAESLPEARRIVVSDPSSVKFGEKAKFIFFSIGVALLCFLVFNMLAGLITLIFDPPNIFYTIEGNTTWIISIILGYLFYRKKVKSASWVPGFESDERGLYNHFILTNKRVFISGVYLPLNRVDSLAIIDNGSIRFSSAGNVQALTLPLQDPHAALNWVMNAVDKYK